MHIPPCPGIGWDGVLKYLPRLALNCNTPNLKVARITGVSHWHPADLINFHMLFLCACAVLDTEMNGIIPCPLRSKHVSHSAVVCCIKIKGQVKEELVPGSNSVWAAFEPDKVASYLREVWLLITTGATSFKKSCSSSWSYYLGPLDKLSFTFCAL
jgi:hypothetical protein